jgi:hypothetical protein
LDRGPVATAASDLDRIARLAAGFFNAPIAAITAIEPERIGLPGRHGIAIDELTTDRSFCVAAVRNQATLIVHDAARDPKFANSPWLAARGVCASAPACRSRYLKKARAAR